jgi:hypothetical protein
MRANLIRKGILSISVHTAPGVPAPFFVMSLRNSVLTRADVNYMLDRIQAEGEKLDISESKSESESGGEPKSEKPEKEIQIPPPPPTYPDFVSAPIAALHGNFLSEFSKLILEHGTFFQDKRSSEPALDFKKPEELLTIFDFSLRNETGTMEGNTKELLQILRNVIKYSAHLAHPLYAFQVIQA